MTYAENRPTPSSGGLVVALVLLLLLGTVAAIAAAYAWFLVTPARRQADLARKAELEATLAAAQMQAALAQEGAADHRGGQEGRVEVFGISLAGPRGGEIPLAINEDGMIEIEGQSVRPADLTARLRELGRADQPRPAVTIRAADGCDFRFVADVLRACKDAGLETVQIAVTDKSDDENAE
jgi:hypothetical protein